MSDRLVTHPNRTNRREAAFNRTLSRLERSVEDQLVLITERRGESRREVSRLTGGEFDNAADALRALRQG